MNPATAMTLVVVPILAVILGWIFWQSVQEAPAREIGLNVPPYGIVTVRLTTEPFPAQANVPVEMMLQMTAPGARPMNLERVFYSYAPVGAPLGERQEARGGNSSVYRGTLFFTQTGEWDVHITIENDGRVIEGDIFVTVE
jgi:hypothetical protein